MELDSSAGVEKEYKRDGAYPCRRMISNCIIQFCLSCTAKRTFCVTSTFLSFIATVSEIEAVARLWLFRKMATIPIYIAPS